VEDDDGPLLEIFGSRNEVTLVLFVRGFCSGCTTTNEPEERITDFGCGETAVCGWFVCCCCC